jgi:Acyl-coenzyme A synthetases/AMP-(fatty) acid ligases
MEANEFVNARDYLLLHRTEYQEAYAGFKWPRLEFFNWALDYFDYMAEDNDNPALWIVDENEKEEKISFAQMAARSNQVANYFRRLGVNRGERIFVMIGNDKALWETYLAAMKLGAIIVPASPLLTGSEIEERLNQAQAKMVVADKASAEHIQAIAPQIQKVVVGEYLVNWHSFDEESRMESADFIPEGRTRATDPLLLYFTSGTGAKPKLVEHTHLSYPVGHLSTMYWLGVEPGDVHMNVSSPGWAMHAWASFFAPWNAEATVFVLKQERFTPGRVMAALEKYPVTCVSAPPTVWRLLVQNRMNKYKVHLREATSAGEPLNPEIIQKVHRAWGVMVRDGYGQTETTAQIGNPPGLETRPGSMGLPLPGCVVRLLNKDNVIDKDGEIVIDMSAGAVGLMAGYRGDQRKSAEVMGEVFYRTGDMATQDEDGYFHFVGREDEVFKSSDYRISPFELESLLMEHEAVAEVAVIPVPDDVRLYIPKAVVELAAGFEGSPQLAKEILNYSQEHLAPYKRIRRLEFGPLPKTATGKIRRQELRAREEDLMRTHQKPDLEFIEDDPKLQNPENWAQELP